jgi:hypothetical protein
MIGWMADLVDNDAPNEGRVAIKKTEFANFSSVVKKHDNGRKECTEKAVMIELNEKSAHFCGQEHSNK